MSKKQAAESLAIVPVSDGHVSRTNVLCRDLLKISHWKYLKLLRKGQINKPSHVTRRRAAKESSTTIFVVLANLPALAIVRNSKLSKPEPSESTENWF